MGVPPSMKSLNPTLLLLVLLPMFATDVYLPAISSMGEGFGVPISSILNTLTSYMFGYSLSLLFAGVLADIYGRRCISILGLMLFCFASIGCGLSTSIEQLIVWRFFQALGGGCGTLIARVIIRDIYDTKNQVRALSYLASGMIVSPILGPIIGAFFTIYVGWRSIFFILALVSFMTLVLIYRNMKETLVRVKLAKDLKIFHILIKIINTWKQKEFIFHTLVISFAWGLYFSFISSSPVLIQEMYQTTTIEYACIFSATLSGFVLGTIFIRRMISSVDIKQLIGFSSFVILVSVLGLCFLQYMTVELLWIRLLLVFSALFGIGIIFPATQAGVTSHFKDSFGLISGLFYSTEMLFGGVFAYSLSKIGAVSWGSISIVMLLAAIAIVVVIFWNRVYVPNYVTVSQTSSDD